MPTEFWPKESFVPRPRYTTEEGDTGIRGGLPYGNIVMEEFLPALTGQAGLKAYREMADNDPIIGAILFAVEMLIRGVTWRVEPADESAKALKARDWVQEELLHRMEIPVGHVVEEALSMLTYGFAPFETVYVKRDDGSIGIRKIAIRNQETIHEWKWTKHGDVIGLEQWTWAGPNVIIPATKILNFRTTSRRGNPEGRSALRNAYITYIRKNVIEESEGRLALRSAGVVTLKIPGKLMEQDADPLDKAVYLAYKTAATNLAKDRQGSIVLPSDRDDKGNAHYELAYTVADGRKVQELGTIVVRQNNTMAMVMLADFITLGHEKVGSFALSSSKTNLFARAVGAFRDEVADRFNELVGRIWTVNAFPPETRPKVVPGDLESVDLAEVGDFLQKITGSGAMMFPSPGNKLENKLMELAHLPTVGQELG